MMIRIYTGFGYLTLLSLCRYPSTDSATSLDFDRLVGNLKENCSRLARPPINQSTLTVNVSYFMNALREFDEVAERFSSIGTVIMFWVDDRMTWDPNEYGGLDKIVVDSSLFWAPPIHLPRSVESLAVMGRDSSVTYYSNGAALLTSGEVITTSCPANLSFYPWDIQSCHLQFSVIGYDKDDITLEPYISSILKPFEYYFESGLWDMLEKQSISIEYKYVKTAGVRFVMKRKPLFVIVNVIIPIVFMSFLNVLVFLIPIESGERLSYCLTVLLAITVFLTLVADTMPKSSTSISYFTYYLVTVLGNSVMITFGTIINMRIYFKKDEKPVPACLKSLSRCCGCYKRLLDRRGHPKNEDGDVRMRRRFFITNLHGERENTRANVQNGIPKQDKRLQISKDISTLPEDYRLCIENGNKIDCDQTDNTSSGHQWLPAFERLTNVKEDKTIAWKDVSASIDAILFVSTLCVQLTLNIAFFTIVPQ